MGLYEEILAKAEKIKGSTYDEVMRKADTIGNTSIPDAPRATIDFAGGQGVSVEAVGGKPSRPAVSTPTKAPDFENPLLSVIEARSRFLPYSENSAAATYAFKSTAPDGSGYVVDAMQKTLDELNTEIPKAESAIDEAWRKADAYSRMNIPQEQITAAATEYNTARKKLSDLTARRDMMANAYYKQQNESVIASNRNNATFQKAMELRNDLTTLTRINAKQETEMSLPEQAAFMDEMREKYGTATNGETITAISSQLSPYIAELESQGIDYTRMNEYIIRQERAAATQKRSEQLAEDAKNYPFLTSLYSVGESPLQGLDLLSMALSGKGNTKDFRNYVPYDPNVMRITGDVNTIRGTVSKEIERNTDLEIAGQNVASFLYNTGLSIGDSALQIAAFGPAASYLMGTNAAANQSRDILERGGTNSQALWGGLAAGAAEAIFERFSVENLLAGKGNKSALLAVLKQSGIELQEEAATEIANILADAAIMGEQSEFNASVRNYMRDGMTEEQAKRKAYLDAVTQVAVSGAGGALSGLLLGGGNALLSVGNSTPATKNAPTGELNARESVSDVPSGTTTTPDSAPAELNAEPQASLPEGLGAMSSENPTLANLSSVGTNTLTNTPYLTEEQRQRYKPETLTYESTENAKEMLAASERLAVDYNGEAEAIAQNGIQNSEDLHVAFALMFDAVQNDGETGTSARQWMERLAEAGSKSGQIVQAFSVYSHTPQGKLVQAQRVVDAINSGETPQNSGNPLLDTISAFESQSAKTKRKAAAKAKRAARLSDSEIKEISDLMQKSNAAEPGSYEANMYEAKANKIIASKLPRTIRGKIVSALMDSMLGNIRTLITRNAGGNLLFAIPEQVSKGFATGIDALVGKATGERSYTVTPSYYKEYAKGLAKGVSDAVKDLRNDVKTPRSGETLEYTAQFSPFAKPVFRGIDRVVQFGLDLSDRPFYEANYAARMAELERIKSKNKLSPEFAANFDALAPLEAQAFALDAVFQSKNAASQGLSNLRLGIQGLIQAATGISLGGQLAMPFTRTGGGILQRTLDYLPGVGTVKNAVTTIGELASKNRTFDQTRFSMESGRNLTGLAATAGLAALVGAGALTGGFYGDDDEKTKEQAGQQEYSVKIGNAYYGYDWIPVFGALGGATADAIEAFENAGENDNAIAAAISAGAKTAAELTAVQGLNRMFGGYSSTPQALAKTMLESTSQISPTVVRQIAGATDKYERQTYSPNPIIQQWNKIRAAWPVLRQTLPVLYDIYGQPVEKNQGRSVVSKLAENMIAPNNFSTVQTDPRTNILLEIAAEGYGTDPTATPKEVKDMRLTAKEYNQFSKTSGTTFGDLMTLWTEDPNFSGLPTSLKSAVVDEAQEFAADKAKREFMKGRGKEYDSKWNDENELPKNVLAEVLIYDNALRTATGENATPESYTAMDALLDAAGGMNKQALAVMHEKALFTRLLEANAAGMTTEQFVNASNGIDKLGQDADFYEKARVIASNEALSTDQKWHMLYDAKNAQSGDKDKVNTAKSLGIPLNDYTTALVLIEQAGATSGKDVVSILNGLGMDNATKSKLYAVFTTTKAKGNGNPYGNDYSDTIRWQYVP